MIGAVVPGVEVAELDEIPDALARHRIVVRRGRAVTLDAQLELTARLGRVVGAEPSIAQVRYEDDRRMHADQAFFNERWHSDVSWSVEGPVITVLCALRCSRSAAPTSLVDTVTAFERLPDDLRRDASRWVARHHVERSRLLRYGRGSPPGVPVRVRGDQVRVVVADARPPTPVDEPGAAHAVVVVDPGSGRRGVTLGDHAWTLDGWDQEEGARRVDDLQSRLVAVGDRRVHHWRPGDVVVFDNRTVLHRRDPATRVRGRSRRRVLRRTVAWPMP